ncbi:hypothetical protein E2C01_048237 [Portunus trituberculatus]|uniref:Uncharacterized protein n=1 Tax=Portunus trituberculatus TaxID=210409 RepID=A0A5B7GB09_PORTR|nr:hypothetical protein [Portunus trituberculatus]
MATAAAAEGTNGDSGDHVPGEREGVACLLQHGLPVLTPSPSLSSSLTLSFTLSALLQSCRARALEGQGMASLSSEECTAR